MKNIVTVYDRTKIDEINNPLFKGHVIIKNQDNKILLDKDNLIVNLGRHWFMQRAFGVPYSTTNQKQNWKITWFSVGKGGATIDDPMTPLWPSKADIDLYNISQFTSTPSGAHASNGYKKIITAVEYVGFTQAKVTMAIDYDEVCNTYVNELALFASPSEANTETFFTMISHVTFPSIPKSSNDELDIEWYFSF